MNSRRHLASLLAIVALHALVPPAAAQKGAAKKDVVVSGILFDFERKDHWLTVKADGEAAPVKYLIDPADARLAESLESVFNAARVRLAYRAEGDSRRLVAIQRQVIQAEGTVTGVVVAVHNGFWVELKPRRGVVDAFAPGANYNDKAFMARLQSLKPGDSVTIQYTTDFERHRILAMRKNAAPAKAVPKAEPKPPAGAEKG